MLSAFNANLKERMTFTQALRAAALSRLRPILLTSLTTVAGLLPITLNTSFQAQFIIPWPSRWPTGWWWPLSSPWCCCPSTSPCSIRSGASSIGLEWALANA
ncbi:MAG: efflux RND transporter permease subunit [Flavobacteriales bacterium]|nr:efflux RND transporter permease subunit [Flavobacteriales bacterium]